MLIFKGFNGTDDLHYAMLAARMVRGEYDPFQPADIFSGRILLIASQAAIYKVAGINVLSTISGPLIVVVISCYLTVFKLLPVKDASNTLIASCLFYFNPVLTDRTLGIEGDIFVLVTGIVICIMLRSWIFDKKIVRKGIIKGGLMAFIIAISLLFKETALIFLPFVCIIAYLYDRVNARLLIVSFLGMFSLMIMMYACFYYYFTQDAFFKIAQITNSHYFNRCSYDLLPFKYLLVRLSYGVWQEFTVQGFYPVIFTSFIAGFSLLSKRNSNLTQDIFPAFFIVLLITALYSPFSLKGYQPLCSDVRQFLFLLPMGVIISTNFICNKMEEKNVKKLFIAGSLIILTICVFSTGNKWQWMTYLFISIYSVALLLLRNLPGLLKYLLLSGILWLSILEHLFFKNSNWFYDMTTIDKRITSKYYYFPDHDNMVHWQLLHHFDNEAFSFYNLEKHPFTIFKIYYKKLDSTSFNAGWLIINKAYNVRSPAFLASIDSLQKINYFTNKIAVGDISAYLVDSRVKFSYVQSLIWFDDK